MLSMVSKYFIRWHFEIFCFLYFPKKTGFGISKCVVLEETICLKCQSLFSGKNKKKYHHFVISCPENGKSWTKHCQIYVSNVRVFSWRIFKEKYYFFFVEKCALSFCYKFSQLSLRFIQKYLGKQCRPSWSFSIRSTVYAIHFAHFIPTIPSCQRASSNKF